MSRSLVLGNGNILLCFDKFGQIRDFYFPYAGLENHIGSGNVHKIGIWVDSTFSWITDPGWQVSTNYQNETMASNIVASNETLGVELSFLDIVYNEKNILLRNLKVTNKSSSARVIKVFFNQQFQISETSHADTAYFNPDVEAVVHYKGRRVFLVGGQIGKKRFTDYSIGIFKIEGKEGTWKDAEDGELSKNPIEHGSVDSTVGFYLQIPGNTSQSLEYWITVAETFREARTLQDLLLSKTPSHITETTQNFWRAWVNKFNFTFYKLDTKLVDLFKKSLLIVRTHSDNNGGILASGDSDNFRYGRDTYAYVWPRDGAFVASALDRTGYFDISHRFYQFASEVITSDGYLLHKYQPDKSFGSSWHPWVKNGKSQLAIQEDETALLIVGLWEHYEKTRDLEFIENLYNSFIKSAADFMVKYREGFKTDLPYASYDLWEEKNGISTFTASSVYGALIAASKFASILGKVEDKNKFESEANEIRDAILEYLWDEEVGYFYKLLVLDGKVLKKDKTIDISSFYGVYKFGVLSPEDPRMLKARAVIENRLRIETAVRGYARYEGDLYYEVTRDVPGNPWFITTMWVIQYDLSLAKNEKDLQDVISRLDWVVKRSLSSGVLSEQVHPMNGEQLSVAPLTWSHAEFILTVVHYLERLEKLGICTVCYPLK
jgi:oligosaccharide amylase